MSEWISVEDRLPKQYDEVLIHIPHATLTTTAWRNIAGEWQFVDDDLAKSVTHWMPLPAPPIEADQYAVVNKEDLLCLMREAMKDIVLIKPIRR